MILSGTIISLQISVYQTFRLFQCCKKSNKGIPDMSTKTTINAGITSGNGRNDAK